MNLLALPILVPLLGAGLSALAGGRQTLRRTVGLTASTMAAAASLWLAWVSLTDGTVRIVVGGWDASIGIALVADPLATLILAVASLVVLATHVHAVATPSVEQSWDHYHAVHLTLAAGVALSLLTGDLFTLFVGFEVSLVASYVLVLGPRSKRTLRASSTYVLANVVVSTLFLIAVAGVYAATGTLNLADLSAAWPELDAGVRGGLGVLLLVVFGAKAAAFPFFGWLPDAYSAASAPVAALLAGLLTKLGVYALVRTETLLGLTPESLPWLLPTVAGVTMLTGVLGALAQTDVRRILSFHIVSQIGYMLFGLGLATELALAGTVFYVVHHILVKSALFLVAGVIEQQAATGRLDHMGGLGRQAPWLAAAFAVPALSLAGIPPLSGFTAKVALFQAGIAEAQTLLVAVAALVSLLTILSMAKIWSGAFWGERTAVGPVARVAPARLTAGTAVLVAGTLVVSFGAAPLLQWAGDAAAELNPTAYVALAR